MLFSLLWLCKNNVETAHLYRDLSFNDLSKRCSNVLFRFSEVWILYRKCSTTPLRGCTVVGRCALEHEHLDERGRERECVCGRKMAIKKRRTEFMTHACTTNLMCCVLSCDDRCHSSRVRCKTNCISIEKYRKDRRSLNHPLYLSR